MCAGSGLKLVSVLRRVLWTYAVAWRERVRRVIVCRRWFTIVVTLSFVGVVSASMLSMVPKCFVYGGDSSGLV